MRSPGSGWGAQAWATCSVRRGDALPPGGVIEASGQKRVEDPGGVPASPGRLRARAWGGRWSRSVPALPGRPPSVGGLGGPSRPPIFLEVAQPLAVRRCIAAQAASEYVARKRAATQAE